MPRFTDAKLSALRLKKNAAVKVFNLDDGLRLRVYPSGVKSFGTVQRNAQGNPQFTPFAKFAPISDPAAGVLNLADARIKLLDLKRHALAVPAATAPPIATARVYSHHAPASGHTFRSAAREWFALKVARRQITDKVKHRYEQTITDHFLNRAIPGQDPNAKPLKLWGDLALAEFTRQHEKLYVETLLSVQAEADLAGARRARKKKSTLAYVTDMRTRKFFKYLEREEHLSADVLPEALEDVNKGVAESRALSVAELERAFAETSVEAVRANVIVERNPNKQKQKLTINEYDAVAVRLMLLSGGRLNSCRLMRRSMREVPDVGYWTIPNDDMKQTDERKKAPEDLLLPMSSVFRQEVARLDALSGEFDYLFIPRDARSDRAKGLPEKPVSKSWADHLMPNLAKRFGNETDNAYTTHALRRTMSNFLLEMGFHTKIIDRCHGRIDKHTDKTYFAAATVRDQVFNAFEQWAMFCYACMHRRGNAYLADLRGERIEKQRAIEAARMERIGLTAPLAA